MKRWFILILCVLSPSLLAQEEADNRTPPRQWEAKTGQKLEAIALAYDGKTVTLMNRQRREIELPVDKLVEADVEYLEEFYPPAPPPFELGQQKGPVDAGGGSSYYVFIPTSFDPRGDNPLVIVTTGQAKDENRILTYQRALQTQGWCYISVVESNHKSSTRENFAHVQRCHRHALKTLPINKKRVYFSGGSAGGVQALYNLSKLRGTGALVGAVWMPRDERLSLPRRDVVITIPANNPYRYSSADIAKKLGKHAFLQFHTDPREIGRPPMIEDSLLWLNARYFGKTYTPDPVANLKFEQRVLAWIHELKEFEVYRAYFWVTYMTTEWTLSETNKAAFEAVLAELGEAEETVQFAQAREAAAAIALKYYAPLDDDNKARWNHTDKKLQQAVAPVLEKFPKASDMTEVLKEMAKPTRKQPEPPPAAEED